MKIVFAAPSLDAQLWLPELNRALPDADIRVDGQQPDGWLADYALVWLPAAGFFSSQPQLKGIVNLGAGVDKLLAQADFPRQVRLMKLRDAGMGALILDYVRYGLLHFGRDFDRYRADQRALVWQPRDLNNPLKRKVAVLGTGAIGQTVANGLVADGYTVRSWGRSPKHIEGVEVFAGQAALADCLAGTDVLVNLLPCTRETQGLIQQEQLQLLNRGAVVISAGRGEIFSELALVQGLESGQLRGALLDVFEQEPLPANSPLWRMDNVLVTPHIAGPTLIDGAVEQVGDYLLKLDAGVSVPCVDVETGY